MVLTMYKRYRYSKSIRVSKRLWWFFSLMNHQTTAGQVNHMIVSWPSSWVSAAGQILPKLASVWRLQALTAHCLFVNPSIWCVIKQKQKKWQVSHVNPLHTKCLQANNKTLLPISCIGTIWAHLWTPAVSIQW